MQGSGTTTFFFDFDGTLADSIPVLYLVYTNFLERFNKLGSKEEFEKLNGPSLPEIVVLLKDAYSLSGTPEELLDLYKQVLRESYSKDVPLKERAIEVLMKLKEKNFYIMLVTSSAKDLATGFLTHYQMHSFFDGYVFGDEVQRSKPSPDIYLLALQKAGVKAEHVVTIEDSMNGICAAKSAGTRVLALAGTHSAEELTLSSADRVITSLSDILSDFDS